VRARAKVLVVERLEVEREVGVVDLASLGCACHARTVPRPACRAPGERRDLAHEGWHDQGMATDEVVSATVRRAVSTARVDVDAPVEPRDERCGFDQDALEAVMRLCDSEKNAARVMAAVDAALQDAIADLDGDLTLAATALRMRVAAGAYQRVVPVENLQGDVGAG
jgi:hypothetical protein